MYRDGHAGFNALLYAPFVPLVSRYWSLELALVGAILAVGLANLPDIDQPLPRVRHRGPTHTVWFAVLVGLLAGAGTALIVRPAPLAFRFGFAAGACSVVAHLAGDIATPMGISPFAPLSRYHVTLGWFKSKNGRINRAFLLVGSTALLGALLSTIATTDQSIGFVPIGQAGLELADRTGIVRHGIDDRASVRQWRTAIEAAQRSAVATAP